MTVNMVEGAEALGECVKFLNRIIVTDGNSLRSHSSRPKVNFELAEVYRAMNNGASVSSHAKEAIRLMRQEGVALNVCGAWMVSNGNPAGVRKILEKVTRDERVIDLIVSCFPASGISEVMESLEFANSVKMEIDGVVVDGEFASGFKEYILGSTGAQEKDFSEFIYDNPEFVGNLQRVFDLIVSGKAPVDGDGRVLDSAIHEAANLIRKLSPHTDFTSENRINIRVHADRIAICMWYCTGRVIEEARNTIARRVYLYVCSLNCLNRYGRILKSHCETVGAVAEFLSDGGDVEDLAGLLPRKMHTHLCLDGRIREMRGSYDWMVPRIGLSASDFKGWRETITAALVEFGFNSSEGSDEDGNEEDGTGDSDVGGTPHPEGSRTSVTDLPEAGGAGFEPGAEDAEEAAVRGCDGPLF